MAKKKYTTHVKPYLKDIEKWITQGYKEASIYKRLDICKQSWHAYKHKYIGLVNAIKKGEQNMEKNKKINKYITKVKPYLEDITKWIKSGENEYFICDKLGISVPTWISYKKLYIELSEAVSQGEDQLTKHLESLLYKRCNGYEVEEIKTLIERTEDGKEKKKIEKFKKHIVNSDTALIFALKSRLPKLWDGELELRKKIHEDELELKKKIHEDHMAIEIEKLERETEQEKQLPTTIIFSDEE